MPALITWWKLDLAELAPQAHSDAVLAIGTDLLRRLAEPHRRYHTSSHVVEMFWALEDLEKHGVISAHDAVLGRVAAWFHDAVYDPAAFSGDNEVASAQLAVRELGVLGLDREEVGTVRDLILATQSHEVARDGLAAAFHDADLWILSAPESRYSEYRAQVREEYAAVPDEAFRAGRAAILRPFLERESVYATGLGRQQWEEQARTNLTRELSSLEGSAEGSHP